MLLLCLLAVPGLAMANTDPRDSVCFCGSGECPAGWKNVEAGCIMFAGWEKVRAREVCRENRAEYSEWLMMREETDSATRHSLPVCLLRRVTPVQVSGSWGAWSAWSSCSVSCGGGITERVRQCDSPPPANGGENCEGKHSESRTCNNIQCPVSGSWSSWSDWSSCSQSCSGGTKTRERLCDSPAPAHGGNDCQGESSQEKQCNTGFCVPGYLGSSGSTRKVELFNPSSGNSCPVQDMRSPRYLHSSCSGLVCGGGDSKRSCEKIMATDISPHPSLELRRKRQHHLCWRLPNDNKILLLGFSSSTTEIVSGESYTSDSFKLKDLTSYACGIDVGEHFIVTGGMGGYSYNLNTVVKYSQSGFVEYLPPMVQERIGHACTSFTSDSGETVLLVTGGGYHRNNGRWFTRRDSTEILETPSSRSWRYTARLPSPRSSLRAVTANNMVFIFGGDEGSSSLDSILSFNKTEESWQPAGQMTVPRHYHAVEVADVSEHCP